MKVTPFTRDLLKAYREEKAASSPSSANAQMQSILSAERALAEARQFIAEVREEKSKQ